jgi:hypothetical protein
VLELVVRDPRRAEAAGLEVAVSRPVGRERLAVGVVGVGVDLDHEPLFAPEGIDGVGADLDVGLGQGDGVLPADPQEEALQVGAGWTAAIPAEILAGAGGLGQRDVVAAGDVSRCERARAVKDDALAAGPAAPVGDRHVDQRRAFRGEGPEVGGRLVGRNG